MTFHLVEDDGEGLPRPGALVMVGGYVDSAGNPAWEAGRIRKCGCCAALFDSAFGSGKSVRGEAVIEFAPGALVPGDDDNQQGD